MRLIPPAPRALRRDEVHVFLASPADAARPEDAASLRAVLCKRERERCDRFLFERDRTLFLVAHALVRQALSSCAPIEPSAWRFVHNAFGRPEIARGLTTLPLRFSLSHTAGLAAVAIALDRDVGVDVEELRSSLSISEIASYALSAREARELSTLEDGARRRRLFELWTLKEAYIKAIGTGLSTPPDRVGFSFGRDGLAATLDARLRDDGRAWTFFQLAPTARHVAAVAVRAPQAARARFLVHRSGASTRVDREVA